MCDFEILFCIVLFSFSFSVKKGVIELLMLGSMSAFQDYSNMCELEKNLYPLFFLLSYVKEHEWIVNVKQ